jgi:uncharacterized protein (TIGR04206 family)
MMNRYRIPLILQILVFIIPINIYVIGDWLGTGVQWALFRYQQTYLGTSFIPVTKDISYVLTGVIGGRSGISFILWAAGVLLFIIATILVILANVNEDSSLVRKASLVTITGAVLLTVSVIMQYGIFFSSQSGFAIPIGIPVILIIGWWMYQEKFEDPFDAVPEDEKTAPVE